MMETVGGALFVAFLLTMGAVMLCQSERLENWLWALFVGLGLAMVWVGG